MRVILYGKYKKEEVDIIKKYGFKIVKSNPDFIFVFGGDGSLMMSEIYYESIPKVLIKKSKICKKCSGYSLASICKRIYDKNFKITENIKLEAESKNKKIYGFNDIVVHNDDPRHAIRYNISINNEKIEHEIIGDGIIVATPFGSSGYFRSITKSVFELGIGLAFNNSTESVNHMILDDSSTIKFYLLRGLAVVYADNNSESIILNKKDSVKIKASDKKFYFVEFDKSFYYKNRIIKGS